MKKLIKCAPSILASDFAAVGDGVKMIENCGAEWVHMDVMDGSFVPEITFGAQMVKAVRAVTELPLDVHLMIKKPENHIDAFLEAGSDLITFHLEAVVHAHRLVQMIKAGGAKVGVSLVPSTPVASVSELLAELDLVLVMTVNPGYGGQSMIPFCLDKVRELAALREALGLDFEISVDGGINTDTIAAAKEAGIDVFVAGSAFFGAENPAEALRAMKNA